MSRTPTQRHLPAPTALLAVLLLGAGAARADTLKCDHDRIAEPGDAGEVVRKICGDPDSVQRETRTFPNGARIGLRCFHGTVSIENWLYTHVDPKHPTLVTVVNGVAERIARVDPKHPVRPWTLGCS